MNYSTAGHFIRFLYETSEVDGPEVLAEAFDQPTATLVSQYESASPYAFPAWEPCPFPEIPEAEPGSWEELSFSCESDDATSVEWTGANVVRRLTLDEPGVYEVTVTGGEGVLMVGCQTGELGEIPPDFMNGDLRNQAEAHQTAFRSFFDAGEAHELDLTAGIYCLALSSGVFDLATVGVRVRKL